jgi:hypothetical protein
MHLSVFKPFKMVLICDLGCPKFFRVSILPEINNAHTFSHKSLSGLESQAVYILSSLSLQASDEWNYE